MKEVKEGTGILDTLFEKGCLIDLHVTWWRGRKQLTAEDLGLPEDAVNREIFSLGQKRLLPRQFTKHWNRWDIQARMLIDEFAFKYGNRLGHFIPFPALEELVEELEKCRTAFYSKVQEFCKNYQTIREEMIELYETESEKIHSRIRELNPDYSVSFNHFKQDFMNKIRAFYPAEPPRANFGFEWSFYQFSLPRGTAKEMKKADKAIKAEAIAREKRQILLDTYKRNVDSQVVSFLHETVSKLRTATVELSSKIAAQVKEGGATEKRVERLQDFIRRFRNMNFLDDKEVSSRLDELETFLKDKHAEQFNTDEKLGAELQKILGGVIESAQKTDTTGVVEKTLGYSGRKVKK